ncbi:MAG TPA: ParB N-terminal domain-containing protein [Allosphingosinicella sp.]|jgi:ParB family chromosome partitioning protein
MTSIADAAVQLGSDQPATVPLSKLYISGKNVRKTDRELDIDALADDIEAHGLLQPLIVIPAAGDRFGVIAGGRRLLALERLKKRGKLHGSHAVPVVHRDAVDGREVSLAENLHKVAMNPVDEFTAYASIIADYRDRGEADEQVRIERCARHFGKTVRHVTERLRLAALAPAILDALRDGAISLDAAKAYAAYPDHKLQLEIFTAQERLPDKHRVASIRASLAGHVYRAGDRQVRYVGLDAYRAAGGRMELELFMGSADEEVLVDTALLDRLVHDKAGPEVTRLARAAGFADGIVQPWAGGSFARPKAPGGFTLVYAFSPTQQERAAAIAIYRITADGADLELVPDYFRPLAPEAGPAAQAPSLFAGTEVTRPPARAESEIEQLGRLRRQRIMLEALKRATPPVANTAFAGRLNWPADRVIQGETDEAYIVTVLLTIPKADVERHLPAAERAIDAEESGRAPPDPDPDAAAFDIPAEAVPA